MKPLLIHLGKASLVTAASFDGVIPERETMILYDYV